MSTAVYPGSFDPITNGHLNILERALPHFDKIIIGVSNNIRKKPMFSAEERMEMIREAASELSGPIERIEIATFDGLLVDYAKSNDASVIIRGLRAISDFEFEFQMTHMNRHLEDDVETVFMMTNQEYFYVSSSLVREVAHFGGSVNGLVPPGVERRLLERNKKD